MEVVVQKSPLFELNDHPTLPGLEGYVCQPFSPEYFMEVGTEAVQLMMEVVRKQFYETIDNLRIKGLDQTQVTACDEESGRVAEEYLRRRVRGARFKNEDPTEVSQDSGPGEIVFLIDPLDGTRSWTIGFQTSTVILAAFDPVQQRVVGCIIGSPHDGRIWRSVDGRAEVISPDGVVSECKVFKGKLDNQSVVFTDRANSFKAEGGRTVLSVSEILKFESRLTKFPVNELKGGSNGLHQALVASGGSLGRKGVAGGVTTARGCAQDLAGAHNVIAAGGYARGFHTGATGYLVEVDPLNPFKSDILVYGGTQEVVDIMSDGIARDSKRKIIQASELEILQQRRGLAKFITFPSSWGKQKRSSGS